MVRLINGVINVIYARWKLNFSLPFERYGYDTTFVIKCKMTTTERLDKLIENLGRVNDALGLKTLPSKNEDYDYNKK